jgi:hexosaminidase
MFKYFLCSAFVVLFTLSGNCQSTIESIIPKPLSVQKMEGSFKFNSVTRLEFDVKDQAPVKFLTEFLAKNRNFRVLKMAPKQKDATRLLFTDKETDTMPDEAYRLTITPNLITINAKKAGLFYAIQTLIQLFPDRKDMSALLPCVKIYDEPRFAYRGLMLDVSRHFFTVPQIKDFLDLMAAYKLNRFHWHLTDDQGWRIEIKSYPKLTSVGSWRVPRQDFGGEPPQPEEKATDGGFYTQDEVREIVKYAAARQIQVMPEIDIPGHSMAAIAAYPELSVTQNPATKVNPGSSFAKWFPTGGFEMYVDNTLNPTDEKVYQFLDKVFGEVAALFPYEYIHIGGDECYKGFWEKDAGVQTFMKKNNIKDAHALQTYFTSRVSKIIRSKNKKAIGWDEILDGGAVEDVAITNRFGEKGAVAQTKKKMNIVLAPGNNGLYFDYAQSSSDMEPINHGGFSPVWKTYAYAADYNALSDEDRKYIMGVEACIWTEGIATIGKLHYMILPRLFALSEVGWTATKNKNYQIFAENALSVHLAKFDRAGFNYRVPTAFDFTDTVMVGKEFKFELKPLIPGSKIYYTFNNRFPGEADHLYVDPIQVQLGMGKRSILKTIVVAPSGKRSVVTRTVMINPILKKGISTPVTAGLTYRLIAEETGKIDTGTVKMLSLPSDLKQLKNTLLKYEGYVAIPKDGYYEFRSDQKQIQLTVAGVKVFDSEKPYPRFDKVDAIFLQKGNHSFKAELMQNPTNVTRIFIKDMNGKEVELSNGDYFH